MISKRFVIALSPLLLLALAPGCSGGDDAIADTEGKPAQAAAAATVPTPPPVNNTYCTTQVFTDVSWKVCITNVGMKGMWISSASISRKPGAPFIQVLGPSGPADVFTVYHNNVTRFYDMNAWWNPTTVRVLTQSDAPAGTLITMPGDAQPRLMKEVRDMGLAWMCKGATSKSRRLRKLVFWSVYDAGNYDFIIEYGFGEDGKISFRTGATGYNGPDWPTVAHMHDTLWHVNVDLNGPGNDTVYSDVHFENVGDPLANDFSVPFGMEGFWDRDEQTFASLRVEDQLSFTSFGNKISYSLEPVREGVSRHYGDGCPGNACPGTELWTQHDGAASVLHPAERAFMSLGGGYLAGDAYLRPILGDQTYVPLPAPPESTANTDVLLWMVSSAHHEPSDEDRPNLPSNPTQGNGVTLVHWHGCDLVPRNFFDYNPVGGPTRCDPYCGDGICDPGILENCCNCSIDCGGVSCC